MVSKRQLTNILENTPVIPAIKNEQGLRKVIETDNKIVFILNADILGIRNIIETLKKHDKIPFIHVDMITGFASNPIVIDYLVAQYKNECGIISTKSSMIKKAMESDVRVIQRLFVLDSLSIETNIQQIKKMRPDAVEIMPGIIPRVIKRIKSEIPEIPIIAGGLIESKEDIMDVLKSGGIAVSTSKESLWDI